MFRSLAITTVALTLTATAAMAQLTKAEVEAIVENYIAKNGDKVMASLVTAQQKQQAALVNQLVRPHSPTTGPANAPITIIEFSDFECPFCDKAQASVAPVRQRYGNRIRWVYKHFPLEFHPKATPAAYAAQAAHNQGKFWDYSKELWKRQQYLSDSLYTDIAKELKLDLKKFNADRASAATKQAVQTDLTDGAKAGVRGTPYFLINGTPLSGAQPPEAFIEVIEAALNKAPTAKK